MELKKTILLYGGIFIRTLILLATLIVVVVLVVFIMNNGKSNTNQLANNSFKIKIDIEKMTIKKGEELNVILSLANQTNSRFSLQYVGRLTYVKILDTTGKELFIRARFPIENKIIVKSKEIVQPDPPWKVIIDHPGEYKVIGYSEFTTSNNDKIIIEAPPKIIQVLD